MNTVLFMIPASFVMSLVLWYLSAPADEASDHGAVVSIESCERDMMSLWFGRSCQAEVEWSEGERDSVEVSRVNRLAEGDRVVDTTFGIAPAATMERPDLNMWVAFAGIGLVVGVIWWHVRRWNAQD
ncbi:hypothetical protein AB0B28_02195 [Glycomyces sp. NPDC046736]|uniref:hypothetical protein n=1 Tax=Glycomyces sp. NPDC046736 TaxID=3155615 RepID=UPI0033F16162